MEIWQAKEWAGDPRKMREELSGRTGLKVECAVIGTPAAVCCEFTVIDSDKPWRKAFLLDPSVATPDAFLAMLDKWRSEMTRKIITKKVETGTVLASVIAHEGMQAVRTALIQRGYVQ